jgi:hypothetical protein
VYKFKNSLIALIGLVSLMTVVTVVLPHTSYGSGGKTASSAPTSQTQSVKVVNTLSEPVPIQGTATVNGTVQAAQAGTWNVGISGTPVVGLDAANNTVKFDAVNNTVKIDAATPVMVRDVDNPAIEPFQGFASIVLPFGQTQGSRQITTVPAGKVLVIEDVSADGRLSAGDKLIGLAIYGGGPLYYLVPNDVGTDEIGRRMYIASQHVRFYFTEGTQVGCFAQRDTANGQPDVNFSVFGYFIDKP